VKTFGGYQKRASGPLRVQDAAAALASSACGCGTACGVHGHAHANAWAADAPTRDARTFWGVFGCACWAV
jgi:hypothetical protein